MTSFYLLLILIVLGFLAHSRVVVLSGFILLLLKELKIYYSLNFISNRGIEIGLIFLLMSILAPLIISPIEIKEIISTLLSWKGLIAIVAGLFATQLNGMGLDLLKEAPQIIIGILIGSLVGIVFFNGIPVGPLMAAGLAALLLWIFNI